MLELIPVATFREAHPELKGTKEEICYALAEQSSPDQMARFIRIHLGRCKQHVYIYDRGDGQVNLPDVIGAEKVRHDSLEQCVVLGSGVSRRVRIGKFFQPGIQAGDGRGSQRISTQVRPSRIVHRSMIAGDDPFERAIR